MYGSQTGNAQSIAEGVHQGCSQRGFDSTLLACDGWKKVLLGIQRISREVWALFSNSGRARRCEDGNFLYFHFI